ncbi:MAG: plasmid stabilization protein [Defluviicoccus sp.]|nr:plasmid stabilization protein [Defluviicoccus sp.]MDE0274255.1 plasmid stabilization protein [Defluviicoccus sp.]
MWLTGERWIRVWASITIRNLNDEVKMRLRVQAVDNGRSMEEGARLVLRRVLECMNTPRNLAVAICARVVPLGGVDLELSSRGLMREPPSFE